jgi:hypothetical protein
VNRVESIEEAIIASSKGLFDSAGIREELHVTIRIARDFYDFLVKFGDSPGVYEIDYMMGTVRSGMDSFYQLAYICRGISGSTWTKSVNPQVHSDFPVLREMFMRGFEHLDDPDASLLDKLDSLFALTHLELEFLAHHFPRAVFADAPDGSRFSVEIDSDLSEVLTDIREMRAGRLSVSDADRRARARRIKRTL